ncbi:MAG: helix-turn-helix transcriptional regulator [Clostridia bacterium]|nr:helix-turn-helix transcriptional regulator [Clostridia bacterium]
MKITIKSEKLYHYMIANNLTKQQFADFCNISMYSLNKMLKGDGSVRLLTLFRVAKSIGIPIKELF